MENLFSNLTAVLEGIFPMLAMLNSWLLSDGLFFGLGIIVLPLLGKLISILKKLGGK